MKKLFLFALIAAFAAACSDVSVQDELLEDDLQLKSGEIPTITIVDGDWLEGVVTDNSFFPHNYDGTDIWNLRIEYKLTIPESYDLMPEGTMYKIQGGLTANSYLDRHNASPTYPWYLYNLDIRKQTKKNIILHGGPLGAIDYPTEKEESYPYIYDGLEWDSYYVFFSKEFKECGPQEVTGEWTVQWEEEVTFEEWDDLLMELGYEEGEPVYPLTVTIEHIIGQEDPLVFDPCEEDM